MESSDRASQEASGTDSVCRHPLCRREAGYAAAGVGKVHALTLAGSSCHCSGSLRFSFIDLFAGIGGFRLGFESIGGHCVFSSEIDKFARRTYEANFRHEPCGDITSIGSESIPAHDVLLAGFPCQPFSLAAVAKYSSLGRPHGFEDRSQGHLFFEIVRILKSHQPPLFVLENVKNLVFHDKRNTYKRIKILLEDAGYLVTEKVLDAKWVVPQHRERVYVVGVLRGKLPVYGDNFAVNWPPQEGATKRLDSILLPDSEVEDRYTLSQHLWDYFVDYARRQRERGNGFGYGLAKRDAITRTLSARYYKDGAEILVDQTDLGKRPRRLTPRECARLMGFPDSFEIPVSDTQAYKQFGNSVVVPLVMQLAESLAPIIEQIRDSKSERATKPFETAHAFSS